MKSLKQLLSKVKSGKMDKKTAKDLEKLVTRLQNQRKMDTIVFTLTE